MSCSLSLAPSLVANKCRAAVERRCREACDASTGAVLEVNFGTHEVLRWCRKNLRRRAGRHAHGVACKRDKHVAKMNSERCPGAGRGVAGVAAPVRRIHLPEIVVAYIG